MTDEPILPAWHPLAGLTEAELHAQCAHPAYEYATTEGPRKAWCDEDVPPADPVTGIIEPGWERNRDRGRNGWDRFEYTEESYWRRLRPDGPRVPKKSLEMRLTDLLRRWTDEDYPTSCINELGAVLAGAEADRG